MIITIDGPATSGKSSVAQALAKDLKMFYLSSGMLFRAFAYILKNYYNVSKDDLNDVSPDIFNKILQNNKFQYDFDPDTAESFVVYDGENITPFLKNKEIDQYSSILGENAAVRTILKNFQHDLAKKYNLVAEGRDMGTAVFPGADYKFFLTASLDERAKRWQQMQEKKGNTYSFEQAKKIVEDRDKRDMERKIDPLKIPDNAIIIDNCKMSPNQTLQKFKEQIKCLK
jgi:CMP/dCMP kinase